MADAKELIEKCIHMLEEAGCSRAHPWFADEKESSWREKCRHWREKYPVVTEEKYKEPEPGRTNIYAFYDSLSKVLPEGEQILVSVGTSRVAGSQAIYLKKGQRFYTNAVTASMGYGAPGGDWCMRWIREKRSNLCERGRVYADESAGVTDHPVP